MKSNNKLLLSLSVILPLTLTACTNTISHNIDSNGHVQKSDLIFPALDKAWQSDGEFPNSENLAKIHAGMAKDNIYQLIGHPHFSEIQHAHEWDYIMKFHQQDNSVKICQYKVIFDKDYKAQEFYWLPEDCAQYAQPGANNPSVVSVLAPAVNEKINLSVDALFAFDKYQIQDMLPQGRAQLNDLAQKLIDYQHQGQTKINVVGHTDYLGDDSYNTNLSLLRAQTVRSYLISRGVDANTLQASGAGKTQPTKQCNSTQPKVDLIECLQPNRRVEVDVSLYK